MADFGRPTKYTPDMCDKVIAMGKYGASQCEMAAELGIMWSTFSLWKNENKDFSDAVSEAVRQSQAWWEKNGRVATFGGIENFNATSYIFQMKNRFRDDWRDKQERELSGPEGRPLQINVTNSADKEILEAL